MNFSQENSSILDSGWAKWTYYGAALLNVLPIRHLTFRSRQGFQLKYILPKMCCASCLHLFPHIWHASTLPCVHLWRLSWGTCSSVGLSFRTTWSMENVRSWVECRTWWKWFCHFPARSVTLDQVFLLPELLTGKMGLSHQTSMVWGRQRKDSWDTHLIIKLIMKNCFHGPLSLALPLPFGMKTCLVF